MDLITEKRELFEKRFFFVVAIYIILDLTRLHSLLSLGFMRPGLIVLILLSLFLWASRKLSESINGQIRLIFIFVLLLFAHVPFAVNNYRAYTAALGMFAMFPFILSVPIVVNCRERLILLVWVLVLISAFLSGYGLMHNGRGPGGSVSDENDLCLLLVTFLPFSLFLLSQQNNKYLKCVVLGTVLLSVLAAVATSSRGGFVGLIVVGIVYWLYGSNKFKKILFSIILFFVIIAFGGEAYRQDMSTITNKNESTAKARLLSWEAGWEMFLDHPLGVGGENFPVLFPNYQPSEFHRNMWGKQAHSLWFTLISETGIPGVLIFFLILKHNFKDISFLRNSKGRKLIQDRVTFNHSFSIALLAAFAGFFASATFLSVLYYPVFWYLTAILVAARNIAITDDVQLSVADV